MKIPWALGSGWLELSGGPGGMAVLLRRGVTIEVNLPCDRPCAVTVDDVPTGVAPLNGLVSSLTRPG